MNPLGTTENSQNFSEIIQGDPCVVPLAWQIMQLRSLYRVFDDSSGGLA
jgi:hypothetical protein